MKCRNCGYEVTADMNFCPMCGKRQLPSGDALRNFFKDGVWEPEIKVYNARNCAPDEENWGEKIEFVKALCKAFLVWAEEWMKQNPDDSVYCKKTRGLLAAMDAECDESYVCCDVYDDRKTGFAITDEGLYVLSDGESTCYSFEALGDSAIWYEDGTVMIGDDNIDFLSEEESAKLYKLLKAISIMFETEIQCC